MKALGEHKNGSGWPYLDQSQVWNHSLDFLDDLWFGTGVEGFELHVEDRLFFWFLLGCGKSRKSLDLRQPGMKEYFTYLLSGLGGSGGGSSSRCSGSSWHGDFLDIKSRLIGAETQNRKKARHRPHILTLSSETKSAACNNVSSEISSTILLSFGSVEVGGGGGVCEVEGVASVTNHRELPDRSAELQNRKSPKTRNGRKDSVMSLVPNNTGLLAHREKFTREAERTTEESRL